MAQCGTFGWARKGSAAAVAALLAALGCASSHGPAVSDPRHCDGVCDAEDWRGGGCYEDCVPACSSRVSAWGSSGPGAPGGGCGDGYCDADDTACHCEIDCARVPEPMGSCGDGWCAYGEEDGSCPADCPAADISACRAASVDLPPCGVSGCTTLLDETISCDDTGFGIDVAPWSSDGAVLSFTTGGRSTSNRLALLQPRRASVRPSAYGSGSLLVIGDARDTVSLLVGGLPDGSLRYTNALADSFAFELVTRWSDPSDPYLPLGGGFDPVGTPHLLVQLMSGPVFLAKRDGMGWLTRPLSPADMWVRSSKPAMAFDAGGRPSVVAWVSAAVGQDLMRLDEDGTQVSLLEGVVSPSDMLDAADAMPGSTSGRTVSAAYQTADGIHVVVPVGPDSIDALLDSTTTAGEAIGCPPVDGPCDCASLPMDCTERAAGSSPGRFGLVRAAGALWVVWVDRVIDRDVHLDRGPGAACTCVRSTLLDRSQFELVVGHVLEGPALSWSEALRFALDGDVQELDLEARGAILYLAVSQDIDGAFEARVRMIDAEALLADAGAGI